MSINDKVLQEVEQQKQRLIHDINSSVSALSQALELANDSFDSDKELTKKIISLSRLKMNNLVLNWETAKIYLK